MPADSSNLLSSMCPRETEPIVKSSSSPNYYMKVYTPPTGITSCVPPDGVIKEDGTVNSQLLNGFVTTFLSQATPPSTLTPQDPDASPNEAREFATKSSALRASMQNEYCHYYNRYIWALKTVLTTAATSGDVVDPQMKTNTIVLNKKLNGILLVMKASVNSRMNILNDYYDTDINSQNGKLNQARQSLKDHSNLLEQNDLKSDVQSAMVDYSIEKNSSSRNLLAAYGFMNIVAVGLLFYLYKNIKE
jgi:hypothetical protein